MKRLFNKNKRPTSTDSPDHQSTPASASPSLTPPPHASSPSQTNSNSSQPHPHPQHHHHQQQGHPAPVQYGPDGQAYMLVPVHPAFQGPGMGRGMVPAHGGGGVPRPPRVTDVGNAIGWSCAMPSFDWGYLLALSDHLNQEGKNRKGPAEEAAKALRKEFKHATPLAQSRAVRLTYLLARNTDSKFRREVASKKFLGALSDLVQDKGVEARVKDMVFRVMSGMVWEWQDDPSLSSVSQTFTKLLPLLSSYPTTLDASSPAFQPSGAPLSEDDPLLRPESLLSPPSSRQGGGERERERRREHRWMNLSSVEQMRDLRKRATEGRGYAGMLGEAVRASGAEGEELQANEIIEVRHVSRFLVGRAAAPGGSERRTSLRLTLSPALDSALQEFYTKTLEAQDFLSTNLEWASVQADQSRRRADASPAPSPAEGEDPFAEQADEIREQSRTNGQGRGEPTEEEGIFAEMLAASTEITDALSLYSRRLLSTDSKQAEQEAADLHAATEASKTDYRFERYAVPGHAHAHGEGEGGSGSATPAPAGVLGGGGGGYLVDEPEEEHQPLVDKGKARARESLNPYAQYLDTNTNTDAPAPASNGQGAVASAGDNPYAGLDEAFGGLALGGGGGGSAAVPAQLQNSFYPAPPSSPPRGGFASSNPYAALSASPAAGVGADRAGAGSPLTPPEGTTESAFLREYVPAQPSERALGKLRRVSAREDSDPQDTAAHQQRLEDALRDKYERNYAEEQARRQG
ncbi:hypothetical protein JCM10207_001649 [Rhodosporidiobolus poonsookiae]